MPSDVREKLKEYIPTDLYDLIATEKDVTSMDEMLAFLRAHRHPIIGRTVTAEVSTSDTLGTAPGSHRDIRESHSLPQGPGTGVSITFHNIRLHADRIFVRKGRK